ncbi:nucleophosmin-like [Petromyzon marinus]|uniref:Nucleophosmin-like n=1 Tax=Petromyzon marinus TaxID=7757 RepID=A0AAJ7TIJ2_PETMA|nr:nucleophosmin-like [Petromyzon marinus]
MADAKHLSFLFGCELTAAKKEFAFEEEEDPNVEHHLLLHTVCLGAGAPDEFHSVSLVALDHSGKMTTVPVATLKPSVQASLSLAGLELAPPVLLRLTAGAGPVHICGQHVLTSEEMFSDMESDEEEEEQAVVPARKRANEASPTGGTQKKLKVLGNEGQDKILATVTPAKKAAPKNGQNGSIPSTPSQTKTPDSAAKPKTPKSPLPVADIKATLQQKVEKGVNLPKNKEKFSNFIKSSFKVEDPKVLSELWAFTETLKAA